MYACNECCKHCQQGKLLLQLPPTTRAPGSRTGRPFWAQMASSNVSKNDGIPRKRSWAFDREPFAELTRAQCERVNGQASHAQHETSSPQGGGAQAHTHFQWWRSSRTSRSRPAALAMSRGESEFCPGRPHLSITTTPPPIVQDQRRDLADMAVSDDINHMRVFRGSEAPLIASCRLLPQRPFDLMFLPQSLPPT